MKLIHWMVSLFARHTTVARFGSAKLMKAPPGRYQLVGGSTEDRRQAREWASLFLHEAVLPERDH